MANSLPKALRERVVEAYENGEGTQRELCERFKLSMASVNSWIQLKRETGSVEPRPVSGGNFSEISREDLMELLAQQNDLSYEEMAIKLQEKEIACSRSSVHRAMVRFGITRKKKSCRDPEQSKHEAERQAFKEKVAHTKRSLFVVLDEAGIWSHMSRTHGYAPKGQRVESIEPFRHEKKQTILAGVSSRGILAPLILDGAMNGAIFVSWLKQELLPAMKRREILVLDNLAVHRVQGVAECVKKAGMVLLYLPPYSPDLSPIEPMWSKIKAFLRKLGAKTLDEMEKAFCQAMDAVTPKDIFNWFQHCGYTHDD